MPKQTPNQRHEVNRAEFLRWKNKILRLQSEIKQIRMLIAPILREWRTRQWKKDRVIAARRR